MIGRKVRPPGGEVWGTVERWDPLSAGLCDTLVSFPDGSSCWYSSRTLTPPFGEPPLPSRQAARLKADAEAVRSLQAIRADHVVNFHERWAGADFGKALFGQALDAAIQERGGPKPKG